mmetsp:Transcript_37904/g.45696  ORF Transcript_37904/g.45696 Transcript_37904/m.45696 type:complete len:202 (-) Transcript_37904:1960-2565(-)
MVTLLKSLPYTNSAATWGCIHTTTPHVIPERISFGCFRGVYRIVHYPNGQFLRIMRHHISLHSIALSSTTGRQRSVLLMGRGMSRRLSIPKRARARATWEVRCNLIITPHLVITLRHIHSQSWPLIPSRTRHTLHKRIRYTPSERCALTVRPILGTFCQETLNPLPLLPTAGLLRGGWSSPRGVGDWGRTHIFIRWLIGQR